MQAALHKAAAAAAVVAAAFAALGPALRGRHHYHWEARCGRQLPQGARQAPPRLRPSSMRQVVHHDQLRARAYRLSRNSPVGSLDSMHH